MCKICRSSTYHLDLHKENIITKLQKLYSPPTNLTTGNKSPSLFLKKRLCTGNLLLACKIFIERQCQYCNNFFLRIQSCYTGDEKVHHRGYHLSPTLLYKSHKSILLDLITILLKNQTGCVCFFTTFLCSFSFLFLVLPQGVGSNAWLFSSFLKPSNVTGVPGCTFLPLYLCFVFSGRPIPQCSLRSDKQLSFNIWIESSLLVSFDFPGNHFKTSLFIGTIPHPLKPATKCSPLSWTNAWFRNFGMTSFGIVPVRRVFLCHPFSNPCHVFNGLKTARANGWHKWSGIQG